MSKYMINSGRLFHEIVKTMHLANSRLKSPKIRLVSNRLEQTIHLTIAGPTAKMPGSINVSDGGSWGDSKWFGRIEKNGGLYFATRWEHESELQADIIDTLAELNSNPAAAAKTYAAKTNACCFCGLPLQNKDSVAAGYGPICAEKYGLPWSGMAAQVEQEELEEKIFKGFEISSIENATADESSKILMHCLQIINLWEDSKLPADKAIEQIQQLVTNN